MKLTDEEREWVEGQNRYWDDIEEHFYVDTTVAKLLESEQAAWQEVDRLRTALESAQACLRNECYLSAEDIVDQALGGEQVEANG